MIDTYQPSNIILAYPHQINPEGGQILYEEQTQNDKLPSPAKFRPDRNEKNRDELSPENSEDSSSASLTFFPNKKQNNWYKQEKEAASNQAVVEEYKKHAISEQIRQILDQQSSSSSSSQKQNTIKSNYILNSSDNEIQPINELSMESSFAQSVSVQAQIEFQPENKFKETQSQQKKCISERNNSHFKKQKEKQNSNNSRNNSKISDIQIKSKLTLTNDKQSSQEISTQSNHIANNIFQNNHKLSTQGIKSSRQLCYELVLDIKFNGKRKSNKKKQIQNQNNQNSTSIMKSDEEIEFPVQESKISSAPSPTALISNTDNQTGQKDSNKDSQLNNESATQVNNNKQSDSENIITSKKANEKHKGIIKSPSNQDSGRKSFGKQVVIQEDVLLKTNKTNKDSNTQSLQHSQQSSGGYAEGSLSTGTNLLSLPKKACLKQQTKFPISQFFHQYQEDNLPEQYASQFISPDQQVQATPPASKRSLPPPSPKSPQTKQFYLQLSNEKQRSLLDIKKPILFQQQLQSIKQKDNSIQLALKEEIETPNKAPLDKKNIVSDNSKSSVIRPKSAQLKSQHDQKDQNKKQYIRPQTETLTNSERNRFFSSQDKKITKDSLIQNQQIRNKLLSQDSPTTTPIALKKNNSYNHDDSISNSCSHAYLNSVCSQSNVNNAQFSDPNKNGISRQSSEKYLQSQKQFVIPNNLKISSPLASIEDANSLAIKTNSSASRPLHSFIYKPIISKQNNNLTISNSITNCNNINISNSNNNNLNNNNINNNNSNNNISHNNNNNMCTSIPDHQVTLPQKFSKTILEMSMIQRSKAWQSQRQQINEQRKKEQLNKEVEGCTFKPILNSNSSKYKSTLDLTSPFHHISNTLKNNNELKGGKHYEMHNYLQNRLHSECITYQEQFQMKQQRKKSVGEQKETSIKDKSYLQNLFKN